MYKQVAAMQLCLAVVFVLAELHSAAAIKLRGNRTDAQVQWGNDAALKACFGENYKQAGASISHCFQEHDTHNTCCMMDKSTRDQNDANGNPIGHASLNAYRAIIGKDVADSDTLLTPWCTCFGSQVCSHYAATTGTKIKFVNDCGCRAQGTPGKGFCMSDIAADKISNCEGWAREQYNMPSHSTPGVAEPESGGNTCAPLQNSKEVDVGTCTI